MTRLAEIIAKLEAATEGSWRLSREIAVLERERIGDCADNEVPPYTTSLDAATSLVPDDCGWDVGSNGEAIVYFMPEPGATIGPVRGHAKRAASPAIGICIAAIKARSAT